MANIDVASPPAAASAAQAGQPKLPARSGFRTLLSELNPLQYVPVIGTIYREVTGDTIPETARFAGSLVVSGLTGGPLGIAMNLGTTLLEHLTGIDPEKIGAQLLAGVRGHPATAQANVAAATQAAGQSPGSPWQNAQLRAYAPSSDMARAALGGADALNALELLHLRAGRGGQAGLSTLA